VQVSGGASKEGPSTTGAEQDPDDGANRAGVKLDARGSHAIDDAGAACQVEHHRKRAKGHDTFAVAERSVPVIVPEQFDERREWWTRMAYDDCVLTPLRVAIHSPAILRDVDDETVRRRRSRMTNATLLRPIRESAEIARIF